MTNNIKGIVLDCWNNNSTILFFLMGSKLKLSFSLPFSDTELQYVHWPPKAVWDGSVLYVKRLTKIKIRVTVSTTWRREFISAFHGAVSFVVPPPAFTKVCKFPIG
jgi:hypothetical protein